MLPMPQWHCGIRDSVLCRNISFFPTGSRIVGCGDQLISNPSGSSKVSTCSSNRPKRTGSANVQRFQPFLPKFERMFRHGKSWLSSLVPILSAAAQPRDVTEKCHYRSGITGFVAKIEVVSIWIHQNLRSFFTSCNGPILSHKNRYFWGSPPLR